MAVTNTYGRPGNFYFFILDSTLSVIGSYQFTLPVSNGTTTVSLTSLGLTTGSTYTAWLETYGSSGFGPGFSNFILTAAPGLEFSNGTNTFSGLIYATDGGAQETFTVEGPTVTSLQASIDTTTNANVVRANGTETTTVTVTVAPAQVLPIAFSPAFGSMVNASTPASGVLNATYTAGEISSGDTAATADEVGVAGCGMAVSIPPTVLNYNGFDFHQSQVSDTTFTNAAALTATKINSFFKSHGSFLTHFYFVGDTAGFVDSNNNGVYDVGEPLYCSDGSTSCLAKGATGVLASTQISSTTTSAGLNPQVLLVTMQKEQSLITAKTLPGYKKLNNALGCSTPSNFLSQLTCGAETLINRFEDVVTYPYFFPVVSSYNSDIKLSVTADCSDSVLVNGCYEVAFTINNAATYAEYEYTPFIQSLPAGGGVYLLEELWRQYWG